MRERFRVCMRGPRGQSQSLGSGEQSIRGTYHPLPEDQALRGGREDLQLNGLRCVLGTATQTTRGHIRSGSRTASPPFAAATVTSRGSSLFTFWGRSAWEGQCIRRCGNVQHTDRASLTGEERERLEMLELLSFFCVQIEQP